MSDIDLKLAERVMRTMADAGLARRAAMELHSTLASDLGLRTVENHWSIAELCIERFDISLSWAEIRDWSTVADVVSSVQAALGLAR